MPMNWTPENDRILLLKMIETHNINVQTELIAKAWPSDAKVKPTSRAISERFVKLRQLAGIGPAKKGGGPRSTVSTPRTPSLSAKKRKVNKKTHDSDESDAEEHLTVSEDDEAPTPTPKSRKISTPKTPRFAEKFSNDISAFGISSSSGRNVKNEVVDISFPSHFAEKLARSSTRATNLHAQVQGDYINAQYGFYDNDVPTSGASEHESSNSTPDNSMHHGHHFNAFGGAKGIGMPTGQRGSMVNLNDMDMSLDNSFEMSSVTSPFVNASMSNNDMSYPDVKFSSPYGKELAAGTKRLNIDSPNPIYHRGSNLSGTPTKPTTKKPVSGSKPQMGARYTSGTSERVAVEQEHRQRTPRQASKQAEQSIVKRLQAQKDMDREYGDRTSEEDSAASEFQGSDDEYV